MKTQRKPDLMWQLLAIKMKKHALPLDQCHRCGRLDPTVLLPNSGGICLICWDDIQFPDKNFLPIKERGQI